MELCTCRAISNVPRFTRISAAHPRSLSSTLSIPTNTTSFPRRKPGLLNLATPLFITATFKEDSSGVNGQFENVSGVVATVEEPSDEQNALVASDTTSAEVPKEASSAVEEFEVSEFLDRLGIKLESLDTFSVVIYGSGALVALWLTSAVLGAIDSIPVFPKVLEIVGLSYTIWFSSRYLIFKKNRDELGVQFEELKQQIFGAIDEDN